MRKRKFFHRFYVLCSSAKISIRINRIIPKLHLDVIASYLKRCNIRIIIPISIDLHIILSSL